MKTFKQFLMESSTEIEYKGKKFYVDSDDLENKDVVKVFAYEDPAMLKNAKTPDGKTLMFKKDDMEDLLKESINDGKINTIKDARIVAKRFIEDVERLVKVKIDQSQIMKLRGGGWDVRIAVDEDKWQSPKLKSVIKEYSDEFPLQMVFTSCIRVPGRNVFWPADNKKYFDIE